jgi:hypothetical protein
MRCPCGLSLSCQRLVFVSSFQRVSSLVLVLRSCLFELLRLLAVVLLAVRLFPSRVKADVRTSTGLYADAQRLPRLLCCTQTAESLGAGIGCSPGVAHLISLMSCV